MSEVYEPDAADYTPERLIAEVAEKIRTDFKDDPPSKALVLFLWDDNGKYDTHFYNAGLKTSEAIALLEVEKRRFMDMLCTEE